MQIEHISSSKTTSGNVVHFKPPTHYSWNLRFKATTKQSQAYALISLWILAPNKRAVFLNWRFSAPNDPKRLFKISTLGWFTQSWNELLHFLKEPDTPPRRDARDARPNASNVARQHATADDSRQVKSIEILQINCNQLLWSLIVPSNQSI